MRIGRVAIAGVLLSAIWLAASLGAAERPLVRIAIVTDGPWEYNEHVMAIFKKEILALTSGEFEVQFPPAKQLQGDWSAGSVRRILDAVLADDEIDLIVANGMLTSGDVCLRGPLPKPVIAPHVLDPKLQGIPLNNGMSGVKNLSYISFFMDIGHDLAVFREVVSFKRLAFLGSQVELEALPGLKDQLLGVMQENGVEVEFINVGMSVEEALDAISDQVEAVYVAPMLGMAGEEFERLVSGLIQRRLPSFSVLGESEVKRGLLMGLAPEVDISSLARLVAVNIQQILLGEDPSALQVIFPKGERLTLNMQTAREIDVYPNWNVITEAVQIQPESETLGQRFSLLEVAHEAEALNRDLMAQERAVAAGREDVSQARSTLLPKLQISGEEVALEADAVTAGFQTERTRTGKVQLTQVIFAEQALGNLSVQGHLQRSRESKRDQVRLDVIQEAVTAYLNVLRAKTFERIQRDNLRLTRSNLELAQIRREIGIAQPGELYRWQSQIATARKATVEYSAQRSAAAIEFNRVLHRPLEEPFSTEEIGLDDPRLITLRSRLFGYLENRRNLSIFRDFLVEEYLPSLPELKQLDAAVSAQERALKSARRAFWIPTIAAQGELSDILSRSGVGSDIPPTGGDVTWNLGVSISFPLFSGGSRFAVVRQSKAQLSKLEMQRESVSERLEQRIRTALHMINSSYASIQFSYEAADAAHKNLEVVSDAYARGMVSILGLLDSQNAVLVADQLAGDAVYKFLVDLMEVERSVGQPIFLDQVEADKFYVRLGTYFVKSGIELKRH